MVETGRAIYTNTPISVAHRSRRQITSRNEFPHYILNRLMRRIRRTDSKLFLVVVAASGRGLVDSGRLTGGRFVGRTVMSCDLRYFDKCTVHRHQADTNIKSAEYKRVNKVRLC